MKNGQIEIKIKTLCNAERILNLFESKKIPIVNTCQCLHSAHEERFSNRPVCDGEHIILIPKRYRCFAVEIQYNVENNIPMLY